MTWVLGMGYVILLWHSLSLPYNYLAFIKIRKVPRKVLKALEEARGFQHFPRDLAKVNE